MAVKKSRKINKSTRSIKKKSKKLKLKSNIRRNIRKRSRKQMGGFDKDVTEYSIPVYQLIYNHGLFKLITRKYQLVNTIHFFIPNNNKTFYNSYIRNFKYELPKIVASTLINTNKYTNVKYQYYRNRVVIYPKGNEVFGKDYLKLLVISIGDGNNQDITFKESLKKSLRIKYPNIYPSAIDPKVEIN